MAEAAPNVFIAYDMNDREFAQRVKEAVAHGGASVRDPQSEAVATTNFDTFVVEALKAADLFVFVVPEREGSGKNALIELGAARALGKPIVALVPDQAHQANSAVAVSLSDLVVRNAAEKPLASVARQVLSALDSH